jgi:NAD(P)H dehydrogenase (quinone)
MAKVLVLYYSSYGHVEKLAHEIAAGAREAGASADVKRVPELLSPEAAKAPNYKLDQTAPVARIDDLTEYDAIVVSTGTRFGRMSSQMASFLDQAGGLWAKEAFQGKMSGAFASSATQHGGQETTLFTSNLLHFGMTVVGLHYGFAGQMKVDEITVGAPCGATTIAGLDAQRQPSENELAGARYQGRAIAEPPRNSTADRREQNTAGPLPRRPHAIKRNGAGSVEEKAEDQDGMEQAEHDLLADLRRARRSLRLQGMDEPPAVARLTSGQRIADAVATVMGSWTFIIVQSAILFVWITANLVGAMRGWDPYPFILLNLALSFQAAYAAPVIMMSQNRQQDIDRKAAENDYRINVKAELEIELLHEKIDQLREREVLKLTEAVRMLTELLEQSASGAREPDAEGGRPS